MTLPLIIAAVYFVSVLILAYLIYKAEEVGPDHPDFKKWDR